DGVPFRRGFLHRPRPCNRTLVYISDDRRTRRCGRLAGVTVLARCHQVGRCVITTQRDSDNMIDRQGSVGRGCSAVATSVIVSPKNLVPKTFRNWHVTPPHRLTRGRHPSTTSEAHAATPATQPDPHTPTPTTHSRTTHGDGSGCSHGIGGRYGCSRPPCAAHPESGASGGESVRPACCMCRRSRSHTCRRNGR